MSAAAPVPQPAPLSPEQSRSPSFVRLARSVFHTDFWEEEREYSRFEAWLDLIASASIQGEQRYANGAEDGPLVGPAVDQTANTQRSKDKNIKKLRTEETKNEEEKKKPIPFPAAAARQTGPGADPRHSIFMEAWAEAFQQHHGFAYVHHGGRDGAALKSLLRACAEPVAELVRISRAAWTLARENRYTRHCRQASTIHGLCHAWNDIRAELAREHVGTPATAGGSSTGSSITTTTTGQPSLYYGWGRQYQQQHPEPRHQQDAEPNAAPASPSALPARFGCAYVDPNPDSDLEPEAGTTTKAESPFHWEDLVR